MEIMAARAGELGTQEEEGRRKGMNSEGKEDEKRTEDEGRKREEEGSMT